MKKDSGESSVPNMADFLAFVRRRRDELLKELRDLEAAERVFLSSRETERSASTEVRTGRVNRVYIGLEEPKSIKEMIKILLGEEPVDGLTAQEILNEIKKRWKHDLQRTSLSPQLSRLKRDAEIFWRNGKWYLSSL